MVQIGTDIDLAVKLLRAGELVAIPTETVYGLAANALDETAVAKIFAAKQRPSFDPLIIHLPSIDKVNEYVKAMPDEFLPIITSHMPGPLTLLLEKRDIVPDITTSGLTKVAVRIPGHSLARDLLRELDFPLAAPSANPFGYISPTNAQHVADQLGERISYILDGGPCEVGLESTIIGIEEGLPTVFRKGGLSIDLVKEYLPDVVVKDHSTSNPSAPGMLKSHYAPRIPLSLVESFTFGQGRKGYISFGEELTVSHDCIYHDLSSTKNFREAAQNLFRVMRLLDQHDLKEIQVKLLPEMDLGIAINDRLRRASAD